MWWCRDQRAGVGEIHGGQILGGGGGTKGEEVGGSCGNYGGEGRRGGGWLVGFGLVLGLGEVEDKGDLGIIEVCR